MYTDEGDGYALGRTDYFDCSQNGEKWYLNQHGVGDSKFAYDQYEIVIHGVALEAIWGNDRLLDRAEGKIVIQMAEAVSFTGRLMI